MNLGIRSVRQSHSILLLSMTGPFSSEMIKVDGPEKLAIQRIVDIAGLIDFTGILVFALVAALNVDHGGNDICVGKSYSDLKGKTIGSLTFVGVR